MRFASYNVENLFLRAKALNLETRDEGKDVLEKHAALNTIFNKARYTAADKRRIVSLMEQLGIARSDDGPLVVLRKNRGALVTRPRAGGVEVVANGRADWVGWLDLEVEEVNEVATRNTARVIRDIEADVLAVVEAETRPALVKFSEHVMPAVDAAPYPRVMLMGDLNDTPDSAPLAPLLQQTDMQDISKHPAFDDHGRPGTYTNGTKSNKIDYILLSPALFEVMTAGEIFRMGVWGGVNGTLFPHYDEITKPVEAASDHAALWCDLDI
jgi:hypothetical protein